MVYIIFQLYIGKFELKEIIEVFFRTLFLKMFARFLWIEIAQKLNNFQILQSLDRSQLKTNRPEFRMKIKLRMAIGYYLADKPDTPFLWIILNSQQLYRMCKYNTWTLDPIAFLLVYLIPNKLVVNCFLQ